MKNRNTSSTSSFIPVLSDNLHRTAHISTTDSLGFPNTQSSNNDGLSETCDEIHSSSISMIKKTSPLFQVNEVKVSPWLKFGLEDDPWKESDFRRMPQLVLPVRGRGPLTTNIIASGISNLSQTPTYTKAYAVTKLDVANRGLSDIELLRKFRCFQCIDISWNEVTDLSPLDNMVYLMCLNASHNKITEALNIKAPWYLTYVSLACNELTKIPDLSEFWSLRYIDFSYNHISCIEGFHNLKYLKYLNLSHNDISQLKNLGGLKIEDLNLEYNKIRTWENDKSQRVNINPLIKSINLSHNCLASLSFVQGLEQLREFYANHNCVSAIEELDYFKGMKYLKKLSLYKNIIASLESYRSIIIHYLPQIEIIDSAKIIPAEREAADILFSPELLVEKYKHQAKLLMSEQLAISPLGADSQPCGEKPYPLVCLVGPHACSKLLLIKRISEDFNQFIYAANNHITSSSTIFRMYKDYTDSNFIVNEDKFNKMTRNGDFLAISESIGFCFGFSRKEFVRSIQEGKLCLIYADLLMAFCLEGLGLKPHLILTIVNDVNIHKDRIIASFIDTSDECVLQVQPDLLREMPKEESFGSINKATVGSKVLPCKVEKDSDFIYMSLQDSFEQSFSILNSEKIDETSGKTASEYENIPEKTIINKTINLRKDEDALPSNTCELEVFSSLTSGNDQFVSKIENSSFNYSDIASNQKLSNPTKNCEKNGSHRPSYCQKYHKQHPKNVSKRNTKGNLLGFSDYKVPSPITTETNLPKFSLGKKQHKQQSQTEETPNKTGLHKNKSHSDSSRSTWSWTSSNESYTCEEESTVIQEESIKTSSTLPLRTTDFILKKIIDSRTAYKDIQDTGYFSHVVYTDDIDKAYNDLKKIIHHIYNTKEEWSITNSYENDPLYEEALNTKAEVLMDLLDKTESTASLKRQ